VYELFQDVRVYDIPAAVKERGGEGGCSVTVSYALYHLVDR
jgi:hypothetical protein